MSALRRAVTACAAGFALAALAAPASAGRFVDDSGLEVGRFVWSPAVAPHPAVSVVVTLSQQSLRVYLGSGQVGIASVRVTGDRARLPGGIFMITALGEDGDRARSIIARGTELFTRHGSRFSEADGAIELPRNFAALLEDLGNRGAPVIISRERSGPQVFRAPGPFLGSIETGSIDVSRQSGGRGIARFATPDITPDVKRDAAVVPPDRPAAAPSTGKITSLVISRADLAAYVLEDGRVTDRLPVAIDDPTRAFGLHAMTLLDLPKEGAAPRWLGFGLDEEAGAPQITADLAERGLRRVRFLDREGTAVAAARLKPGSIVVLMDGHGPSATEVPRTAVALLNTDDPLPRSSVSGNAAVADDAGNAKPSGRTRRSHASKKQLTAQPRRRGPLDHLDGYPNSIYWPY